MEKLLYICSRFLIGVMKTPDIERFLQLDYSDVGWRIHSAPIEHPLSIHWNHVETRWREGRRLLLILSKGSRAYSFVALEEGAKMGLILEAELVGYLLYGHRRGDKKCFGALHECALDKQTGRNAECLFDGVGNVARREAKLVGIPIE